jgi:hypothetical protein
MMYTSVQREPRVQRNKKAGPERRQRQQRVAQQRGRGQ